MNPFTILTRPLAIALEWLHDVTEPLFGDHAWGWAIIILTILVRVALLPLAVRQTRSMRAMQALQPKVKAIQKKHKVDREAIRRAPAAARAKKQKASEEVMALYRENGVNPATGCMTSLLQLPEFLGLYSALASQPEIKDAPFYVFTDFSRGIPRLWGATLGPADPDGLGAAVSQAAPWGWVLAFLMIATMFISQKQMMGRTQVDAAQAQQQKIMLYVLPAMLGFISINLPVGVLLYWVTTNFWTMGQQAVILREVSHHPAPELEERPSKASKPQPSAKSKPAAGPSGRPSGDGRGKAPRPAKGHLPAKPPPKGGGPKPSGAGRGGTNGETSTEGRAPGHLPGRPSGGRK